MLLHVSEPEADYAQMIRDIRELVDRLVPPSAAVAVANIASVARTNVG